MFWIGCLREQFLRFSKNYLLWFNRILLLFDTKKSFVFQILLLRSIKAYFCPNIINFDSMDFSERRPEEVISFFWRSVYLRMTSSQLLKKRLSKINCTRLPWIAGSSRNHMIHNCPTTSQETFNDGYNDEHSLILLWSWFQRWGIEYWKDRWP